VAKKRVHSRSYSPASAVAVAPPAEQGRDENSCRTIVGVGASAGGLEAFKELLNHLPDDTGMASC
jgi:two-component system, chemotaxis family, CheB/CheR fusion protein